MMRRLAGKKIACPPSTEEYFTPQQERESDQWCKEWKEPEEDASPGEERKAAKSMLVL
jgi:hypothetical protein